MLIMSICNKLYQHQCHNSLSYLHNIIKWLLFNLNILCLLKFNYQIFLKTAYVIKAF